MELPAWLLVFLAIGATARITRLITADAILKVPREAIGRKLGTEKGLGYLVLCDWCTSFWVGVPVAVGTVLWGDNRVVIIALLALTASLASGLLAQLENE